MTTLKDFQIISKLGEGAYSSVYKVKRMADSHEYALKKVKLMNLSDKEKQNALNEVRILASISHPNIISYKEAFIDDNSNSLCIIMEYANNGDLFQKICEHQKKGTNFQEPDIWSLFIQMTKALKALHDLKIFHRDLKSANVFLNKDGTVKLGDLNVSKVAKKGLLYTQTGTPYYASPEVWRDMPYDHKSDVWSLGCVLYEVTTLNPPFRAEDMEGLYKKVLKGYYPRIPTHYSQDLNNIIRALLQVSPHLRPSCDRILQLPAIVKRIDERFLTELEEGQQNILLSTIRIPKNLKFLTEKLPRANYNMMKLKKVDKHKFLQTLAGYKDPDAPNRLEEGMRGSESVDSYKKDKDHGRIYLPAVGKDNSKDVSKIYGVREKREHKVQPTNVNVNVSQHSGVDGMQDYDDATSEKSSKTKKKVKNTDVSEIKEPVVVEKEVIVKKKQRKQSNEVVAHKIAYKVHDLSQDADFDKHVLDIRNIYGGKQNKPEVIRDPVQAVIKKHRNLLAHRGSSQEMLADYDTYKKQSKLPPIGPAIGGGQEKSSKLPPLIGGEKKYENTISPKKAKLKELTKAYKINVGNLDDISDKYAGARQPKKGKYAYSIDPLEYGVNGIKYGRGYDNY